MLKKILDLFLKNQWKVVYSTKDVGEYAKIKGKLINASIQVETKMINRYVSNIGWTSSISKRRETIYNILVKSEEIYKANEIINNVK